MIVKEKEGGHSLPSLFSQCVLKLVEHVLPDIRNKYPNQNEQCYLSLSACHLNIIEVIVSVSIDLCPWQDPMQLGIKIHCRIYPSIFTL